MILLGASGYARSGKDTFAAALEPYGFKRLAFADILRDFLYRLDPIVETNARTFDTSSVMGVIEKYGWDGYKNSPYSNEIRALLQRLGTECGRELLGDSIWVDSTLKNLAVDGKYVVTDCRFPNEADAIRTRGGKVVRVTRKGVGPVNNHPSEVSLDKYNFDYFLTNNGSKDEFLTKVRGLFA